MSVFGWSLEAAVDAFFTGGAGHLGSSAGPAVDTAKVAEVFAKYKEPDGDEIQEELRSTQQRVTDRVVMCVVRGEQRVVTARCGGTHWG